MQRNGILYIAVSNVHKEPRDLYVLYSIRPADANVETEAQTNKWREKERTSHDREKMPKSSCCYSSKLEQTIKAIKMENQLSARAPWRCKEIGK